MTFNYTSIPKGFYDKIFENKDGVRKFWHWHKFDSVVRSIDWSDKESVLDVGCFSGSFTGRFLKKYKVNSLGVDILPEQIAYAQKKFPDRPFLHMQNFSDAITKLQGKTFDVITFIEVIEHLTEEQIKEFFNLLDVVTKRGSEVIITTPNYLSLWPLVEFLLNRFSDVKYEEQHITKFTHPNIEKKLIKIVPEFSKKYQVTLKTTSHFISPLISAFSYSGAKYFSSKISPVSWHNPLGCILIIKLKVIT